MYDNVRICPNCGSEAPCFGSLKKCCECGCVYCSSCSGTGYGGMCPCCNSNESKSF